MIVNESSADWRSAGACLSADPDLFYPISDRGLGQRQVAQAKVICASCSVRRPCLEFALAHDQSHGIWGGTTPEERRRYLQRERRGVARRGFAA